MRWGFRAANFGSRVGQQVPGAWANVEAPKQGRSRSRSRPMCSAACITVHAILDLPMCFLGLLWFLAGIFCRGGYRARIFGIDGIEPKKELYWKVHDGVLMLRVVFVQISSNTLPPDLELLKLPIPSGRGSALHPSLK